jgi:tetratricopeptide (TPR) repeat protein
VELATLYNQMDRPKDALNLLLSRKFQPWEGGEGLVLAQYVWAHSLLGQAALDESRPAAAVEHFKAALNPQHSLGEVEHLLASHSVIDYWMGVAYDALGNKDDAVALWKRAAAQQGDFQQMQVHAISDTTFWCAMALRKMGKTEEAAALFKEIYDYSAQLRQQEPKIDYFATSLPTMLLFDEDLKQRQDIQASFLQAQALVGMGETERALALLQKVQQLDRNHTEAADLIASLTERVGQRARSV